MRQSIAGQQDDITSFSNRCIASSHTATDNQQVSFVNRRGLPKDQVETTGPADPSYLDGGPLTRRACVNRMNVLWKPYTLCSEKTPIVFLHNS